MEFLKALFESGALTWEEFSQAVTGKGYKLADLSTGSYVSRKKYEDELAAKDSTISDLTSQIDTRDSDLADLKSKLETAGTDNKTKVAELTTQIAKLQGDYDSVKSEYEGKLSSQAYEFAVKEFAGTKKFSSNAAKRDFINEMIREGLKMKDGALLGAEDFVKSYAESNSDAFVPENPDSTPPPTFVNPSTPTPPPSDNAFLNAFSFVGVRPKQ